MEMLEEVKRQWQPLLEEYDRANALLQSLKARLCFQQQQESTEWARTIVDELIIKGRG